MFVVWVKGKNGQWYDRGSFTLLETAQQVAKEIGRQWVIHENAYSK
jgi:hypothetical protein